MSRYFVGVQNAIHHVTLEILPDLQEEVKQFYSLVGFSPVEVPGGVLGRSIWIENGGCQIHLLFSENPSPVSERTHFALVVPEFESVFSSLVEQGYEPERRAEYWGSPRAYVRDPAGHLVELMRSPPNSESPRTG